MGDWPNRLRDLNDADPSLLANGALLGYQLSSDRFVGVSPTVAQLLIGGHSRMAEGAASMEDFGVSHKTARRLRSQLSLVAQGGSCLCAHEGASIAGGAKYGGIGRLLQTVTSTRTAAPYLPAWQAAILDWGLNDMGWMGPATFPNVFPHGLRAAISRLRAGAIFEDSDASVTYTGTSWATVGLTSCNSGSSVRSVSTAGDYLTVAIPADFPGGTLTLRFITGAAGQGALWTIGSGTGSAAGVATTFDTRSINGFDNGGTLAANGKILNCVKRITGLPAGAGTLRVTATTINTTGYFDCWEIESPYPGPVAAGLDVRAVSYGIYSTWPYTGVSDADVTTIWSTVNSVAAEFDASVFGLVADDVFLKNPLYFATDGIHWNDLGHSLAADRLAGTVQTHATPLQLTESGGLFKPYFYPLDGTGAGNAFLNSWVNYSGTQAGYRKDNLTGEVQLRGWVTKTTGSATDPMFTLPPGYRPIQSMDFGAAAFNGTTFGGMTLRVMANGTVQTVAGGSLVAGNANEINVSFQAEQ